MPSLPLRRDEPVPILDKSDPQSHRKIKDAVKRNCELHSLRCDLELKLGVARY